MQRGRDGRKQEKRHGDGGSTRADWSKWSEAAASEPKGDVGGYSLNCSSSEIERSVQRCFDECTVSRDEEERNEREGGELEPSVSSLLLRLTLDLDFPRVPRPKFL